MASLLLRGSPPQTWTSVLSILRGVLSIFSFCIPSLFPTFLQRACNKVMSSLHRSPELAVNRFLQPLSQDLLNTLVLMRLDIGNDASSMIHFRSSPCYLPRLFYRDFLLSLTTHQFPSEQHKVVCNQYLHIEYGRPTTISSKVTEIHFIQVTIFYVSISS